MKIKIFLIASVLVLLPALASAQAHKRVFNDATRLAALLSDAQKTVNFDSAVWRVVGNEANVLANRIYAGTAGHKVARSAARDLRMHVREFRRAALNGDAAGARAHAAEAQPFVYQVIEWAK